MAKYIRCLYFIEKPKEDQIKENGKQKNLS